ncbi:MAG: hypothetical protein IJ113_03265 [Eggerthellaceae bacterium]|nr:hypothetical protein [Eggerthellaceae bacterium]
MQPFNNQPKKTNTGVKLAAGVGVAIMLGLILASFIAVGLFFHSCTTSFSDPPIGDTAETKAFIKDPVVTERDLETFDIIRGGFEKMYIESLTLPTVDSKAQAEVDARNTVDEYRARLAKGIWPESDEFFLGPDSHRSPQLWVRLAQLSEDYLEKQTGEQWRIVGLSYPFPSNGPIPVPPKRTEDSTVYTHCVCESGADEGLNASVAYKRWVRPATFSSNIEEVREQVREQEQMLAALDASKTIEGRKCLLGSYDSFYVFARGEDDELRNPDTFVAFAKALAEELDSPTADVYLLEADTPIVLRSNSFYEYGNDSLAQIVDYEQARKMLVRDSACSLETAPADTLLTCLFYNNKDKGTNDYSLYGYLVPKDHEEPQQGVPRNGLTADSELGQFVAEQWGISEDQVAAFSLYETEAYSNPASKYSVHIMVPRGALPEDYYGFYDAVYGMHKALWKRLFGPDSADGDMGAIADKECVLYAYMYVVDADTLEDPGGKVTFAQLREAGLSDPAQVESFTFDAALYAHMGCYAGDGDNIEDGWTNDFGVDLEGTISESREWFLAQEGL